MKERSTGVYESYVIRYKKEIKIPRGRLEKKVENIKESLENLKEKKYNLRGYRLNLERLKRIVKTGNMLLDGYSSSAIASELNLKNSTIESYIFTLAHK